jgi:nucleotide-binding universal stress UspA family protein
MSNEITQEPVVVGINGSPASQRGVRYAAMEARAMRAPLVILHITPTYAVAAGVPPVPEDVLRAYGAELLEVARKTAQSVVPGVEVETRLVSGGATVHGLAEGSEHAALLVLGAERRSFAGRIWTGDVVAGVAAQAPCPVVVVPPEWEPEHDHGRIVVATKDPSRAAVLVSAGMALAHRRGAELVIMHAWNLPAGYDDIVANQFSSDDYGHRQAALLEPLVEAQRSAHPDVPVRIEVLHTQPAHALVSASAKADHLLISRPPHGGVVHHLGGVGRAVLQEARCPVEIRSAE